LRGFIDLQTGSNRGHLCRTVLCNLAADGVETWFATFPPERGHRMVTLSIGPDAPAGCAGWARPRD
jgi:hypothetical protein